MLFRVTASLPDQFSAIVEADSFPLSQQGDTVTAAYSIPTTQLHFVAGPYITQKLQVRDDFFVYTMFFREDQKLADEFLEAARS